MIALNIEQVPSALAVIIDGAFNGASAAGGFAGATVWAAIRFGVARGIFSNEAGLGSAPIAHAAARTSQPVEQGLVAMLGTFIDTLVVCTMTGLVIILTGVLETGSSGASLTASAFGSTLPGGELIVTLGVVLFATHDHDWLVFLWRALRCVSRWYSRHFTFSGFVGACDPRRRRHRSRSHLAGCGHAQCVYGYSQSHRTAPVVARRISVVSGLFRGAEFKQSP